MKTAQSASVFLRAGHRFRWRTPRWRSPKKSPDGRHRLVAVRVTGESGEIDPVAIPAPAAADSTSPGAAEAPFSVCDVWAEHPLYELLTVEDVQIFAGIETLQEMKLIPLPENTAPRDAAGEVRVTPQDL